MRKVGEAVTRFKMIRDGDRVAVALSGGKDSLTMLEALILLRDRAPIQFTVCAFTVEQGKFLRPIEPMGEYLKGRGIDWTYHTDNPSIRLIDEKPDHGCDLCSRFRRRAVYQIARELGANVIAFGHTADDICESFLRNALFNGRISSLPAITWSPPRHHVVAPAFAGAFASAAMGAFEGWSQTGHAARHPRRQSRRQGKRCKHPE